MKLLILLVFITSCSSNYTRTQSSDYVVTTWKIFDKVYTDNWSIKELISTLGHTKEKYTHPQKKHSIAWLYRDKKTNFQEWSFEINKEKKIINVLYHPNESYRDEFTIEKMINHWKDLNCKHKQKQELSPGLVKTIKYIECNNGSHVIRYNRYNEVESVSVKNSKY